MTGAIFFSAECTAPWGFAVPAVQRFAHLLAPGTERLVGYHLVAEGSAKAHFDDDDDDGVPVTAGDLVIVPNGDAHTVSNGSPRTLIDSSAALGECLSGSPTTMRLGGGGEITHFICGYFGCDRQADRLFLAGLPRTIKINIRGDPAGAWLESSVRHLLAESGAGRPGQSVLLSRMAEALFIEGLRRYMEQLPSQQTGWLAGARDPLVGSALALMHRRPCDPWTVSGLAEEVGASRSVLKARFAHFLGESPMSYLLRWRLQLAARRLQSSRQTMLQLALDVGYESEAAFNRAFKREFGLPPAQYRRQRAEGRPGAA